MGELSMIAGFQRLLGRRGDRVLRGPGDDASVVRARPVCVTSIDTVADGTHFRLSTHSPADVGHKALATALSDLAAMGAEPGEAHVALALPDGFGDGDAAELVEAMEELAGRCGVTIAGGDVVRAATLVVTVSVTGWAERADALVGRDGALPGHLVGVTGELGGAAGALLALEGGGAPPPALLRRHLRPEPLLEAGSALAAAGATAMIDLSDGLATDAGHVARVSGCRLELELERLPLAAGLAELAAAAGRDAHELAATGGDDYELLVAGPEERSAELERAAAGAGTRLTWLGRAETGSGVVLRARDGGVLRAAGYEHE